MAGWTPSGATRGSPLSSRRASAGEASGHFILEQLEAEAAARGLNYIYNVVPDSHPDGPWIKNLLSMHGFHEASRGQLRRQVQTTPTR